MQIKDAIQTLLPGTYCHVTGEESYFQVIFKHPKEA